MYLEENMLPNIYGCFRCGEINGEISQDEETLVVSCQSCGEDSIVTFQQALDLLNDFYLKGEVVLAPGETEVIELEFLPLEEE